MNRHLQTQCPGVSSTVYSQEEGQGHWGLKVPLTACVLEISGVDLPARKTYKAEGVRSDRLCAVTGSSPSGAACSRATRAHVHGAELPPCTGGREGPIFEQEAWLTISQKRVHSSSVSLVKEGE